MLFLLKLEDYFLGQSDENFQYSLMSCLLHNRLDNNCLLLINHFSSNYLKDILQQITDFYKHLDYNQINKLLKKL